MCQVIELLKKEKNILTLQTEVDVALTRKNTLWPPGQIWSTDVKWPHRNRLFIRAARIAEWTSTAGKRSGKCSPFPLSTPTSLIMIHGAQKCFHSYLDKKASEQSAAGGGWNRGCNQWWQFPWCLRRISGKQRLHCELVSPSISYRSHVSVRQGDRFPGAQTTPPLTLKICSFNLPSW